MALMLRIWRIIFSFVVHIQLHTHFWAKTIAKSCSRRIYSNLNGKYWTFVLTFYFNNFILQMSSIFIIRSNCCTSDSEKRVWNKFYSSVISRVINHSLVLKCSQIIYVVWTSNFDIRFEPKISEIFDCTVIQ